MTAVTATVDRKEEVSAHSKPDPAPRRGKVVLVRSNLRASHAHNRHRANHGRNRRRAALVLKVIAAAAIGEEAGAEIVPRAAEPLQHHLRFDEVLVGHRRHGVVGHGLFQ